MSKYEEAAVQLVSAALGVTADDAATSAMSKLSLDSVPVQAGTNTTVTALASTQAAESGGRAGRSAIEKAEVQQWLSLTSRAAQSSGRGSEGVDEDVLLDLNTHLARQTFLVGEDWTIADLAAFARLHATVEGWSKEERSSYCHITRWLDHIQHLPCVVAAKVAALPVVDIDTQLTKGAEVKIRKGAPKEAVPQDATRRAPGQKADTPTSTQPQKQGKKAAKDAAAAADGAAAGAGAGAKGDDAATKAEKKAARVAQNKAAAGGAAAAGAGSSAADAVTPARVSFKVGHILKCEMHPDADSLYVSSVDVGEASPRTVVSGLVKYIPLADMQGRRIVAVCNLKPVAMRGVKSAAMVLAASPKPAEGEGEKTYLELVQPPEGSQPGDVLTFEGHADTQPDEQLNPKKKVFETVQPGFTTSDGLDVVYRDVKDDTKAPARLVDAKGNPCKVKSLIGASIR